MIAHQMVSDSDACRKKVVILQSKLLDVIGYNEAHNETVNCDNDAFCNGLYT